MNSRIFSSIIQKAIKVATEAHDGQMRKVRDIPFITHPLSVGLILAKASTSDQVIASGILHDTIEDTKITYNELVHEFGEKIADTVRDVTEIDKSNPWEERKSEMLERIKTLDKDSLLVKSADLLQNMSELLDDFKVGGEIVFNNFSRGKDKMLDHCEKLITAIESSWPQNPLLPELNAVLKKF